MLLVLLPALSVLESLVELRLAASELFKHRKGVIAYRRVQIYFFPSAFWVRKPSFGLPVRLLQEGSAEPWLTQQSH